MVTAALVVLPIMPKITQRHSSYCFDYLQGYVAHPGADASEPLKLLLAIIVETIDLHMYDH